MKWFAGMSAVVEDLVERGRAVLQAGDAAAAREAVDPLVGGDTSNGDVLEILARADYSGFEFGKAIEGWERADAAHRAAGGQLGAVRVARTLAGMYNSIVGDFAVSAGWPEPRRCSKAQRTHRSEAGWRSTRACSSPTVP
jgi:hypothetical protein